MSIESIKNKVGDVVRSISDGNYDLSISMCASSRLSAKDIRGVIEEYGRTLAYPPPNFSDYFDIVEIRGRHPVAWSIRVPLWTLEEGRSDLTLELTVIDAPDDVLVELDDIEVL